MTETTITRSILKRLNALDGCKAIKIHSGAFQGAGTPDVLAVREGAAYLLEVKTDEGRTTRLQEHTMEQWRRAGAVCAVVRSAREAAEVVMAATGQ